VCGSALACERCVPRPLDRQRSRCPRLLLRLARPSLRRQRSEQQTARNSRRCCLADRCATGSDIVEQEIENAKKLGTAKLLEGANATGKFGGMKDKVDAPTYQRFTGPDPRTLAAEKKALEIRKEALQVTIKTKEENHKSSLEAKEAAREALMAALSGERAAKPTSKERRVNRMMAELENPSDRKTGLTSGMLSKRMSPGEKATSLTSGSLSSQSRSISARGGVGKALSEFNKAKEAEKQNAANLQNASDMLKLIEKGINGE